MKLSFGLVTFLTKDFQGFSVIIKVYQSDLCLPFILLHVSSINISYHTSFFDLEALENIKFKCCKNLTYI